MSNELKMCKNQAGKPVYSFALNEKKKSKNTFIDNQGVILTYAFVNEILKMILKPT